MSPDSIGFVLAATIAGSFSVLVVILQARATRRAVSAVHEEVKTNHGARQGQRIEDLSEDMRVVLDGLESARRSRQMIRAEMATNLQLQGHADLDLEVAKRLAEEVEKVASALVVKARREEEVASELAEKVEHVASLLAEKVESDARALAEKHVDVPLHVDVDVLHVVERPPKTP